MHTPRWLLPLFLVGACMSGDTERPGFAGDRALTSEELTTLRSARVLFSHQSVGRDILSGLRELVPGLRVVSINPETRTEDGAFFEAQLGRNGDPSSKDRGFLKTISQLGTLDLAVHKYCFTDLGSDTDPDSLFREYRRTLRAAERAGVHVMAVTMPLTTVAPTWKQWVKRVLGRTTSLELNARRQEFNRHLRDSYGERALIDLARYEATLEDGAVRTAEFQGEPVEVLAKEYTDDGAHLNRRGRQVVGSRFLRALLRGLDGERRR